MGFISRAVTNAAVLAAKFSAAKTDIEGLVPDIHALMGTDVMLADSVRPRVAERMRRAGAFFLEYTQPGEMVEGIVHRGSEVRVIVEDGDELPFTVDALAGRPGSLVYARGRMEAAIWALFKRSGDRGVKAVAEKPVAAATPLVRMREESREPVHPAPPERAASDEEIEIEFEVRPQPITLHETDPLLIKDELISLEGLYEQVESDGTGPRRLRAWGAWLEHPCTASERADLFEDIRSILPHIERDIVRRLGPDQEDLAPVVRGCVNRVEGLLRP